MARAGDDSAPVRADAPPRRFATVKGRTRERTAALNQLLFAAVILALAALVAVTPFPGDLSLFFFGVVLVFAVTGVTLVVPWNRLSLGWMALVPVSDVVAATLMREANPGGGFGLLWVFPAMWLPTSFGFIGLVGGVVGITTVLVATTFLSEAESFGYSSFLLPLVIVAVSGASYLTARRGGAQRRLLDRQAGLLSRALERTRGQEHALAEVLDAVDFGVIRLATDGSVSVANEAHARLQRATSQHEPSQPSVFREDGETEVGPDELPFERALRGEAFDGQVFWFGAPGSDRKALSVTVRRLRNPQGADAGAVLVSRDVTRELEALRARDALVATVSHELRTPLTSILGYLDLVIDDPGVPARSRDRLEIAERNAERLLGIVADILRASSASRSSVELTITPTDIDIADVLRASIESLQPRADERAITIDDSGIEAVRAYADGDRLRQVVDNLLANGIKYNRDGGVLAVGSATNGDSSWIVVRDTGIGLTEEEISRVFERFYRSHSARTEGVVGTGLGLSISRDIVRAHGGDIALRSTPGVGSTFIVRLPATRHSASPAPRLPEREREEHDDEGAAR